MKTAIKPANAKAWALFKKLEVLAERGVDGEKVAAQHKLARLKARFDFTAPKAAEAPDLFSGSFKPSAKARHIYSFDRKEFDVANSVKWAIESATQIPCAFQDNKLMAEAAAPTARRLTKIAEQIASSFRSLVNQFSAVAGVSAADRNVFVMGLYDGMMNEVRTAGQPLPNRPQKQFRGKKRSVSAASNLHIHPYTVAVSLGKQIRFSTPLAQISGELAAVTQKALSQSR